jgi:hypothetical protein
MTIDEEGWETVDAQSYFVEKLKKKFLLLLFFAKCKKLIFNEG